MSQARELLCSLKFEQDNFTHIPPKENLADLSTSSFDLHRSDGIKYWNLTQVPQIVRNETKPG